MIFRTTANLALVLVSVCLLLLIAESTLRIFFSENFVQKEDFAYKYNEQGTTRENRRGSLLPTDPADKKRRILVQGDSLTWGWMIEDWRDLYPYKLLALLNQETHSYGVETLAYSGLEIDSHLRLLKQHAERLAPDTIIYLWYLNDLEVSKTDRPKSIEPWWRKKKWHKILSNNSYLYRFIEFRLGRLCTDDTTSYAEYIHTKFSDRKSVSWVTFEHYFREWAVRAGGVAKRVFVFLYPTLPYSGSVAGGYPFIDINKRVAGFADAHDYYLPPQFMKHQTGRFVKKSSAPFGQLLSADAGKDKPGYLVFGRYVMFPAGSHKAVFSVKWRGDRLAGDVATIDVSYDNGKIITASKVLITDDFADGSSRNFSLDFDLPAGAPVEVEMRLYYHGKGKLSFESVMFPLDLDIEVIDLLPLLAGTQTHATLFDAHPNRKTHNMLARKMFETITKNH